VSPGLGNPVMKVEVRDVPAEPAPDPAAAALEREAPDDADLQARLLSIEQRLRLLEQRLLQSAESP
jgi:hypothetical protein